MTPPTPIPLFPERRELLLEDRPFFDRLFRQLQPRISELTFAGLYLFREAHAYRVSRLDESLVVTGRGYDGTDYALPPLGGHVREAAGALLAAGWELYGIDDGLAALLTGGGEATAREDRDNFDYLYRRVDLADLPGNRYHKKKNRISYFTRRHDCIVEEYRPAHRDGCRALLGVWRQVHDSMESGSMSPELEAAAEALASAVELGLEGIVVLVGGEVKAFALGERLNATTAVCHFEKADPFLDGLFQLVNREFSRRLFTDCAFVNREQDLGVQNLRQTKLSYHPVELVRKCRVRRS